MKRLLLLIPTATYRAGAFVDAARRLDANLTIASEEPSSLRELIPRDLMTLGFSDPVACADDVERFARDEPIDAVVGVDDQVTIAAAAISKRLHLPHNPVAAAEATRDKHEMRRVLRNAGVPVPDFQLVPLDRDPSEASKHVTYPCVLKPLNMSASRGVIRANSPDEFIEAFQRIVGIVRGADKSPTSNASNHLLVEDYVQGWEVAVEGILTDGRLHVFTIFDKPDPLEGPYFAETIYVTPSRLAAAVQKRIVAMTYRATNALGLRHGPIHAELRGNGTSLSFLEVAARSIGGYCSRVLRFKHDESLEDVIIRHAMNPQRPMPELADPAASVMMIQAPFAGIFRGIDGIDAA
ncbi:MAG: ATP-grasp domain-containing protein, partial [bacterium]|nr:ATP-grasp domain-containing protein [bacterium]